MFSSTLMDYETDPAFKDTSGSISTKKGVQYEAIQSGKKMY